MAMASPWGMCKAIFAVGSLGILAGCGSYTSSYVAPNDGRARVLWDEDRAVASLPSESSHPDCSEAVRNLPAEPEQYSTYYGGGGGVRVYYRPWIIVRPAPVVIVGSGRVGSTPGTVSRAPATPTVSGSKGGGSSGGGSTGGSSGGGGGGGGNGDLGKAAIVIAVVALVVLPIITLSLGLTRPEPEGAVASAIDEVNAYNDLARLPGSPCAAPPAGAAQ